MSEDGGPKVEYRTRYGDKSTAYLDEEPDDTEGVFYPAIDKHTDQEITLMWDEAEGWGQVTF